MKLHRIVGGFALASTLLWLFTGVSLWVPLQQGSGDLTPFSEAARGFLLAVAHIAAMLWAALTEADES